MNLLKSLLGLAAAATLAFAPGAFAEAPQVKTQVPGWYRLMVGDAEVTALYDGYIDLDAKLLKNATPEHVQKLLARMFAAGPAMQTAVNAYAINAGGKLVLVDTGAAKLFGPTLGNVLANLKAAGYDAAQVDAVLLTHLHGDHMGGLIGADGKPAFAKAEVLVSKIDSDFWLSEDIAAKAPEGMKGFFKMARDVAAPYVAAGKWKTFKDGDQVLPGITARFAPGHTPGHSGFELESKGQRLLFWGDIVHSVAVQFAKPEVSIEFDTDQALAVATRKKTLQRVAAEKRLVAGSHLPFPGVGHVRADGKGSYTYVPVSFGPLR